MDEKDFEKILMAMIPLTDACRMQFVSSLPILDIYMNNHLNQDSIDNDTLTNIQNLRTNLQKNLSKDL